MTFTSLLTIITPHRRVLLAVVILMTASAAIGLLQPWLAGQLTEALLVEDAPWSAQRVLVLWLWVLLMRSALDFCCQYYTGTAGEHMTARLRSRLFQHMQAIPQAFYHQSRKGDVLTLLSQDAEITSSFVTDTLTRLLPLILTFFGAVTMMLLIDPVIALVAAMLLPLYYLAMKVLGRRIRPLSRAWIDAYSNLVSFVEEHLGMKPAIKSFTRETLETEKFETRNSQLLSLSRRQILLESLLSPSIGLLAGLGLLLLFWLGSARIEAEMLSPAELVTLILYAMMMSQPLRSLADLYGELQRTRGAAERIIAFLSERPEPDDADNPDAPEFRGTIQFESVDFRYPDGSQVLKEFDLRIDAGETVGLIGPNGSGKSTIAYLLQRMADPDRGRITIDGVDITSVSIASLRRQIGLVAQNTLLVNGTVSENIAYGRPLSSQEDITSAAARAMAVEFIENLPDAYDTVIGDHGVKLSGGQRQKISLARTLLLDPTILILDEATAMFDPESEESFVLQSIELLKHKTVIIITHRPVSLDLVDRVISLTPSSPA